MYAMYHKECFCQHEMLYQHCAVVIQTGPGKSGWPLTPNSPVLSETYHVTGKCLTPQNLEG